MCFRLPVHTFLITTSHCTQLAEIRNRYINIACRYEQDLHVSNTNLSSYDKGVNCEGTKLFSALPSNFKT